MSEDQPDRNGQVTVSFVMIAHNEQASVARALESVIAQRVDKEVLVVDDGSTDRTADVVAEIAGREPAVRLIRVQSNRGRGFARDLGVRHARGSYIATVDADIVLPPEWWARCSRELEEADAVGGIAVPDGDIAYLCSRFGLQPRPRRHTAVVTGSNGVYRRELLERGSFDRELREGEDIALNHTLLAQGARLRSIPDLTVTHLESKGFAETARWLFHSGRGATRQLWRYRQVRLPDLAFAGWLACAALSATALPRRRWHRCAPLLAFVSAASLLHVARGFSYKGSQLHRLLGAAATDALLLNAYFCGRLDGFRAVVAGRPSPQR